MAQITIDIDDVIEAWLKRQAKASGLSVNSWVSQLLQKQSARSTQWPEIVKSLSGTWPDFPDIEELRDMRTEDNRRESF
jgi:hypothetical protein